MFVCVSVDISAGFGQVCFTRKIKIRNGGITHKAPYHGTPVTFSYSSEIKTLTLWFHYNMENAEVIITKDGEKLQTMYSIWKRMNVSNVTCLNVVRVNMLSTCKQVGKSIWKLWLYVSIKINSRYRDKMQ